MLIGIISDTHGDIYGCRAAVRVFESYGVDQVLHCGDIGAPEIVDLFAAWPAHFVYGNVDSPKYLGNTIAQAGQTCHDFFGSIHLEDRSIALLHGNDARLLDRSIKSGDWDIVCHGHTHAARHTTIGKTLVVNPGAIARTMYPSVAVIDLDSLEATPLRL